MASARAAAGCGSPPRRAARRSTRGPRGARWRDPADYPRSSRYLPRLLIQLHRPARGRRALDRVDQLVAPHGEIEIDVETPAAAQRVGRARVGLTALSGLPRRPALPPAPL